MNLKSIPFSKLPFTNLYCDYTEYFANLREFFETDPHSENAISDYLQQFDYPENRDEITDMLLRYNRRFEASDTVQESVRRLANKNTVAIVTGQQLGIYGGPLYTVYKIITAILTARHWEQRFGVSAVPVFWMADEDHDYEEVSRLGIPGRDEIETFKFPKEIEGDPPVGSIKLGAGLEEFRNKIVEEQFDTDFSHSLWKLLDGCYKEGRTFEEAFGRLILSLFGEYGIILAGSSDKEIKTHFAGIFESSVRRADDHYKELQFKSDELKEKGYHQQVHLNRSNLFRIDEDGNRVKLTYENGKWMDESAGVVLAPDELVDEINRQPERFSPNVFLRPIFQSRLLPCAAYIGGPGEIAYYAQMRSYYEDFKITMPIILPRFSATLVESGIDRIMEKLPFDFTTYNDRIEDLEAGYIEHADTPDVERMFGEWRHKINEINKEKTERVREIDPTLKGAAEKVTSFTHNELEKLKGKVYRSLKDQEETQLNRIRKIKNHLFPNRNLQEREVAFIYFMNKYGTDLWNDVLELLEDENPNSHKLIYL